MYFLWSFFLHFLRAKDLYCDMSKDMKFFEPYINFMSLLVTLDDYTVGFFQI